MNSSFTYPLTINLYSVSEDVDMKFIPYTLNLRSGTGTASVMVSVPTDISLQEAKILATKIYANFTLLIGNETIKTPIGRNDTSINPLSEQESYIQGITLPINVLKPLSLADKLGGLMKVITTIIIITVIWLPLIFLTRTSFLDKRIPDLIVLSRENLIQTNATIIAGVLIILTIEGLGQSQQEVTFISTSFITAYVVIPFSISSIYAAIDNRNKFAVRFMIVGFIHVIISVILIFSIDILS